MLLLLFPILSIIVSTLRTHDQTISKRYDQYKYLNNLKEKQQRFTKDINAIKQQIKQIDQIVNGTNITQSVKLSKLQESMAQQRDSLYNIQTYLKLPFSLKACQCVNYTAQKRQQMKNKLINLNNYLIKLKENLKDCPDCPLIKQIKRQVIKQQNYIKIIQQTLSQQCCKKLKNLPQQKVTGLVNKNDSLLKDNLKAQNWYYGNLTINQYMYKTFQMSSKYNLTSCSIQTPYAVEQYKSCINCNDGGYFNLGTRNCQNCPPFSAFEPSYKKCYKVTCKQNQIFNNSTRKCQECPYQTPVYNATTIKCQPCDNHSRYDNDKKQCKYVECKLNQMFDLKIRQCKQCPKRYPVYNKTSEKCQECPQGWGFNSVKKQCEQCPLETPKWNHKKSQCQKCPQNSVWNKDQKNCMSAQCPKQYPKFNPQTLKCEQCPTNNVYDEIINMCRIKNTTGLCPDNKPIYDPTSFSCKPCPQGSVYDHQKGQCRHKCQKSEIFNWQKGKCESICKPPLIYVNQKCKTPQQIKGCPKDQIFIRSKNSCVKISTTCRKKIQYYNKEKYKCQTIPICPINYIFNTSSGSCQQVNYSTSPDSANLILGNRTVAQYQEEYKNLKKSDSSLKDCPIRYPFFNKKIKKCVACPKQYPYFNIVLNQCQDCGDQQYNQQKKVCNTKKVTTSPTLQRLIMNII